MKYSFKSKQEQYNDLVKTINSQTMFSLTADEELRFQDAIGLLEERGYLGRAELEHITVYKTLGSLDDFGKWLNNQVKEEKRLSRREWKIAVIGTLIGALIGGILGSLPTIITFFQQKTV